MFTDLPIPTPPATTNAPVVVDVDCAAEPTYAELPIETLFVNVARPVTDSVDLNVTAPVTPNPAATSNVEPIIVAPDILPVPNTVKLDLRVAAPVTPSPDPTSNVEPIIVAPDTFNVDLRTVAPVTPNPEATSNVEPIIVAPDTFNVDLSTVAPVTPNPLPTSNVEPIIVAPDILPVLITTRLELSVAAPLIVTVEFNVAPPSILNPVPPNILPLTPIPPVTCNAPEVEDVEFVLSV